MTRRPISVLLVEDDPEDVQILMALFKDPTQIRVTFEHVSSISEAVERLKTNNVEAILSDLGLPDTSGVEAVSRLHAVAPDLPIVVLTSLDDETMGDQALREGAQDYLIKGLVDSDLVSRTIRYAVERKRAARSLKDAELKYSTLFQQSRNPMVLVDMESGRIIEFNHSAHESLGYTKAEFKKLGIPDFEVIEDVEAVEKHLKEIRAQGSDSFETKHITKTGDIHNVVVNAKVIELGGKMYCQSIYTDITERKRADEKLHLYRDRLRAAKLQREISARKRIQKVARKNEQYLDTIISTSQDSIMVFDSDGRFEFANDATFEIFGWPKDELMGEHFLKVVSPDRHNFIKDQWRKVRDGDGAPYEIDIISKDGKDRTLLISHRRMRFDRRLKHCLVVKDITPRRRMEDDLREVIKRLEMHDREKTEFVSNVSHELRTPLTSMTYATDNLLSGVLGPLPQRIKSYLVMIREDCDRLLKTVTDILDLTRLESKSLKLNKSKLPFSRLVRHCFDQFRFQCEKKGQEMCLAVDQACGFVCCDPLKMDRAIANVIQNAIRYTPEGGRINVVLHPANEDSATLVLSVVDNGAGISEEHLPHVTERFFRVGEHVIGTGLGLPLCKEIVEIHGGHIDIVSPPPGEASGTMVSISMPESEPPTVTVVSEERRVCDRAYRHLVSGRYCCTICEDATNAVTQISRNRPDAVVLDLSAGGTSGLETIAEVKSDNELRRIPIIALTAKQVSGPKLEVLHGFGIPVLTRPWVQERLVAMVEQLISGGL